MIERLDINSIYISKLYNTFFDLFTENDIINDIKNNNFTNYLVFIVDTELVAFINYYTMYERAEIININVIDSFQNKKIATKLMEYMINDCKNKNINSITLEVKKTNIKAISLYNKFGFKNIGIRKGYYQGIDAILMEKELM